MSYVGTLISGKNIVISWFSSAVPVMLSSGQPLDRRACHSLARGLSNRSIYFDTKFEIHELYMLSFKFGPENYCLIYFLTWPFGWQHGSPFTGKMFGVCLTLM